MFAGDDTWKMFRMFQRAYFNRDSLFVNDFYEGDRNVTDSLRHELKRDDWKLLILREIFNTFQFRFIDNFHAIYRLFRLRSHWSC